MRLQRIVMRLFDVRPVDIDGFQYSPEFVSRDEESALVAGIRALEFRSVVMHGVTARRRVVQFGQHYRFQSRSISPAHPIPEFLWPLRDRAAALTTAPSEAFGEALVTEYQPGAGIGWRVDAPAFGIVVGVSLLGHCRMKLRPSTGSGKIVTIGLEPRSVYVLAGTARWQWRHSIPPANELRYSVTFRTLRG